MDSGVGLVPEVPQDFSIERLRWIVKLRWFATASVVVMGFVVGFTQLVPSVAWEGLVAVGLAGLGYNVVAFFKLRKAPRNPRREALFQASCDQFLLTLVLWLSGGIESPFLFFYVFHVALIGIVGGPRAASFAAGVSVACALFLACTHGIPWLHVSEWDPAPPWGLVAHVAAFFSTALGIAFIVAHAVGELRQRDDELQRARRDAALEYQLLTTTLNELGAGLEVLSESGVVLWRNRGAEMISRNAVGERWSCRQPSCHQDEQRLPDGACPAFISKQDGSPGRCHFPVWIDGEERLYHMLSFPLAKEDEDADTATHPHRVMNLYVDQTKATLDDRRLVLTERLVSLGRVAQGVAHELNTPLATIRTLATDMRSVLSAGGAASLGLGQSGTQSSDGAQVHEDLLESALLIQDETRRLGRITQALLAGGDLVQSDVQDDVSLRAVVERARALVFAGRAAGPAVHFDAAVKRLKVDVDPDRLVQVLVNLLQNASDAVRGQEHGEVRISAEQKAGRVTLTVEDNGPGLSDAVKDKLFEPFVTDKPEGEGTGLGLYTSFMLVKAMGGTLTIENRREGGVRAAVELSTSKEQGDVAEASAEASQL